MYKTINQKRMNKNPLLFVLILLTSSSINIFSQDFSLFEPINDIYTFAATSEGANAFRHNPAILGLKHKMNAALSFYLHNYNSKVVLHETDVNFSAGILGLGFRGADTYDDNTTVSASSTTNINEYSLGLGFGSKSISAGALFQYSMLNSTSTFYNYVEGKSVFKFGAGILYRPNGYISAALTYHSDKSFETNLIRGDKYTLGLGVRPFMNNRITIAAEFSIIPYFESDVFNNNSFKAGIEAKIINGIKINAQYMQETSPDSKKFEMLGFGMNIEFPNFGLGYSNPLVKHGSSGSSYYRSSGNQISLEFNFEKKKSFVPDPKKIIEISLSGSLQDFNTEDVFFGFLGQSKRSVHEIIADIDYAAADPSVKGMLLKIYPLSSGRFEVNAAIEELCASLERFKKRGKNITAYLPQDTRGAEYFIATYANDIVMPADALFFYGLSIEIFNYKQFLDKYGIELQNFHAGEYKLTFQGILDSTTEQGKEVINRILDVVYEKMMSRTITARNLMLDDYLRDKLSKPLTGAEALKLGLVDKNGWYEDAKQIAEKKGKSRNLISRINRNEWDDGWGEPEQIAIIGVYGTIMPGESDGPSSIILPIPYVGGGRSTGSETVLRQLENAFSNPRVRAIILRVDSGGGSALASSEINDAIIRLKRKYKKPFIVSMGNAAASGGYYVSVNADKIFSDDLTITGSIGVWASRPNLDSLLKGQKIKVEIFKRGESSDIGSFVRKLNEEDVEIIQGIIDFYYDRFIDAVSSGRKMTKNDAEQFAKGRVWLGTDAFNKKLVDEIGGLYQAINYAKKKSHIDKNRYNLVYYAVPGGNSINDLVTQSIMQYIQANLINMFGAEDDDHQGLEIKY
jgi:protease IV